MNLQSMYPILCQMCGVMLMADHLPIVEAVVRPHDRVVYGNVPVSPVIDGYEVLVYILCPHCGQKIIGYASAFDEQEYADHVAHQMNHQPRRRIKIGENYY